MPRLPLLVEQLKRLAIDRPRSGHWTTVTLAPVSERQALWWWMEILEEMERGYD